MLIAQVTSACQTQFFFIWRPNDSASNQSRYTWYLLCDSLPMPKGVWWNETKNMPHNWQKHFLHIYWDHTIQFSSIFFTVKSLAALHVFIRTISNIKLWSIYKVLASHQICLIFLNRTFFICCWKHWLKVTRSTRCDYNRATSIRCFEISEISHHHGEVEGAMSNYLMDCHEIAHTFMVSRGWSLLAFPTGWHL